jgi:predicted GNAT family acetyltransferase
MATQSMTVQVTSDTGAFAEVAGTWLSRDPISTNVINSVLADARAGSPPAKARWVLAFEADDLAGVAMLVPPHPLNLPPMGDDVVHAIALHLHNAHFTIRKLSGSVTSTEAFARDWESLTGAHCRLSTAEGVYVLDELVPPVGVPESARTAAPSDTDLITEWTASFISEARHGEVSGPCPAEIARRIDERRYLLWESDGEPVSLAGWHRPSAGYGRVGPVYTPPSRRGHGFGAAVTAAATRAVLASGADRAMLFADLANPTSNGVYQRLGFRKVHEASEWIVTVDRQGD